jgi:hypothetical protein
VFGNTLLRAKPSKGGDAELRDYREVTRHVRRAASDPTGVETGGPFALPDRLNRQGEM